MTKLKPIVQHVKIYFVLHMPASEVLIWIFATSLMYSVELYVGFIRFNYFGATKQELVEIYEIYLDVRKLYCDFERVLRYAT